MKEKNFYTNRKDDQRIIETLGKFGFSEAIDSFKPLIGGIQLTPNSMVLQTFSTDENVIS